MVQKKLLQSGGMHGSLCNILNSTMVSMEVASSIGSSQLYITGLFAGSAGIRCDQCFDADCGKS